MPARNALMTKPARVVSLVSFIELVVRISEDHDHPPMRPSCAHWRMRDVAFGGWSVLLVKDPE